jgi:hypothetical protein
MVEKLNRERAGRCIAAATSPSDSTGTSFRLALHKQGRGQAPLLSWSPAGSSNRAAANHSIPFGEEIYT